MDIIGFITANSQVILMLLSIILAVIARYFQSEASILARAGQALIDLQQEFLSSINDGVITQEELDRILAKIQAAEQALRDVLNVFTNPVPVTQKIAQFFGGGIRNEKIASVKAEVQTMKIQRIQKLVDTK
jgi:hypothetical protein